MWIKVYINLHVHYVTVAEVEVVFMLFIRKLLTLLEVLQINIQAENIISLSYFNQTQY